MHLDLNQILTLGLSIFSVLIAVLALIFSQRASEKNEALQRDLNAKSSALETSLNEKSAALQREMDQQKGRIEKRRFITVLWDRMFTLTEINSEDPIEPDIRHAYNTLDAVAMSWEADLVDQELVVVSFGKLYIRLYDQIKDVKLIPGRNISGANLLQENPLIKAVYDEIQTELNKRARLSPLKKA
jgi:hypothetical protein